MKDAKSFGWKTPEEKFDHDWTQMVTAIQDHIVSLNWGYRVSLRDKKVMRDGKK
jgi:thioredoxin reductase (NADPH)